jgi:glycosyltransferase involved in cell wall biosynthesis
MPYLNAQGVSVDLLPFADQNLFRLLHKPGQRVIKALASVTRFLRRVSDVVGARSYDAVLIHRAICIAGPAVLERLVATMGRPVIYDFDDAIFKLHTTEANRHFGWLKFPGKTATICRLSDHIVVGNQYLADYARTYNRRVTIIPTSINVDTYRPDGASNGANGKVVVGWMGSSTSQTHLEMFAPVLRQVTARDDIELQVVSDREPVLPGVQYVWRQWSSSTEVSDLARFDIGIMPMPDDEWARGKCAAKALQYMAMAVPTVCSAVGTNLEVVRHGENGLLATTSDEWVSRIGALAADVELRRRLGLSGRRTVEEGYSMTRCAELFAGVVREVVAKGGRTRVEAR